MAEQSSWHCVGKGTTGGGWRFVLTTVTIPALESRAPLSCLSQSRLHTVNKSEVRARIWSAAMSWGKNDQLRDRFMETGVQLSNPTLNTRLVCIVCIVLQWCMYLLYVYIAMHSPINDCKLCTHRISSWLSKYETMLNCTKLNKSKFQDEPPHTKTTECVSSAEGGEWRACQTGSD